MRSLLLVALAVAGCHSTPTPVSSPSPWAENTFDANVQALLAKRFPGTAVAKIDNDDGYRVGSLEVRFAKARSHCREDWTHCADAVERTLLAADEAKHPAPVQRSQLRVILRANEKLAVVEQRMKGVRTRPFSSNMQWVLAVNMPNLISYTVKLDEVGMSEDEAWNVAIESSKPGRPYTASSGTGMLIYQDDYAPSALKYPDMLVATAHELAPGKTGKLLAVCPEENILIYTLGGAADVAAMRKAATAAIATSTMPLSADVMEWSDGQWREVRP